MVREGYRPSAKLIQGCARKGMPSPIAAMAMKAARDVGILDLAANANAAGAKASASHSVMLLASLRGSKT